MAIVNLQFQANQSQKIILMCMVVVVVAALVERYSGTKETASVPQMFVGAFIATSLLMLLSYIVPEFAVGLATVTTVGVLISKGQPFWDAIDKVLGANKNGKTAVTPTVTSPLAQQNASYQAYSNRVASNYSSAPLQ